MKTCIQMNEVDIKECISQWIQNVHNIYVEPEDIILSEKSDSVGYPYIGATINIMEDN